MDKNRNLALLRTVFSVAAFAMLASQGFGADQPDSPIPETTKPAAELPKELKLSITDKIDLKLVLIPAGTFIMGTPDNEKLHQPNEGPQHQVTISKPFYMSIHPVTQEQYEAIMGTDKNKSPFKGPQFPIQPMTYDEIGEFCQKLSEKTGKKVRLNTEAEWEYACRAGTPTAWFWGNDDKPASEYAWFSMESFAPHPVGQKKPNPWGLYDLYGNRAQICSDWGGNYPKPTDANYPKDPVVDPTGPTEGKQHIVRGGLRWPGSCRSGGPRGSYANPAASDHHFTFRIVVESQGENK